MDDFDNTGPVTKYLVRLRWATCGKLIVKPWPESGRVVNELFDESPTKEQMEWWFKRAARIHDEDGDQEPVLVEMVAVMLGAPVVMTKEG